MKDIRSKKLLESELYEDVKPTNLTVHDLEQNIKLFKKSGNFDFHWDTKLMEEKIVI